jgi:hypothetical protein
MHSAVDKYCRAMHVGVAKPVTWQQPSHRRGERPRAADQSAARQGRGHDAIWPALLYSMHCREVTRDE